RGRRNRFIVSSRCRWRPVNGADDDTGSCKFDNLTDTPTEQDGGRQRLDRVANEIRAAYEQAKKEPVAEPARNAAATAKDAHKYEREEKRDHDLPEHKDQKVRFKIGFRPE